MFFILTYVFDNVLLWAQSPLWPGLPHSSGDLGLATRPCRGASGGQPLCRQQYENHQLLKDIIKFIQDIQGIVVNVDLCHYNE